MEINLTACFFSLGKKWWHRSGRCSARVWSCPSSNDLFVLFWANPKREKGSSNTMIALRRVLQKKTFNHWPMAFCLNIKLILAGQQYGISTALVNRIVLKTELLLFSYNVFHMHICTIWLYTVYNKVHIISNTEITI